MTYTTKEHKAYDRKREAKRQAEYSEAEAAGRSVKTWSARMPAYYNTPLQPKGDAR